MKAEVFCTYQENGCLPKKSHELILTQTRQVENNVVNFYPAFTYQRITGFGGAMTEAAACTLSKLSDSDRDAALKDYFGEDGSGYWLFIGTAATILKL